MMVPAFVHTQMDDNPVEAELTLVLVTVPVLDPAGFIGLRGNGLTPSKINDFLSAPLHYGFKNYSESLVFGT